MDCLLFASIYLLACTVLTTFVLYSLAGAGLLATTGIVLYSLALVPGGAGVREYLLPNY